MELIPEQERPLLLSLLRIEIVELQVRPESRKRHGGPLLMENVLFEPVTW